MATYTEIAQKIIKDAIKSAIFIDENAREAYQPSRQPVVFEEKLSVDLYNEFRQNDVSLVSFKYKKNSYRKHKTFLLNGRDIVLLDWKLNGDSGEEEALEVMRDAVSPRFHIPFCVVYTSEEQTKNVFDNILSFFIGASQEKCDDLRLELLLEDEPNFQEFLTQLSSIIHSGDFSDEVLSPFKTKFWEILSKDYFVSYDTHMHLF